MSCDSTDGAVATGGGVVVTGGGITPGGGPTRFFAASMICLAAGDFTAGGSTAGGGGGATGRIGSIGATSITVGLGGADASPALRSTARGVTVPAASRSAISGSGYGPCGSAPGSTTKY